jgi:hypothetical protein
MILVVGDIFCSSSMSHGMLLIQRLKGTIDRDGKTDIIIEEILHVSASQYVGKEKSQARQWRPPKRVPPIITANAKVAISKSLTRA